MTEPVALTRYAWLSIAAALVTMALKTIAYLLSGSVGLLSDALESTVNLAAGVVTLIALRVAMAPADDEHQFGHEKAEYVSSGVEAALILVAAAAILTTAIQRLIWPEPLGSIDIGLAVGGAAALVNLVVARVLLGAGQRARSIALEADGHHLMTDVWTSVGVLVGVGLVAWTGWQWLDSMVAMGVAAQIMVVGWRLLHRSGMGLLDRAVPAAQRAAMEAVLGRYQHDEGIAWHALRTWQAGARTFVTLHVLVPGAWTVQRGHDLCERIERELRAVADKTTVIVHLEPLDDARSFTDLGLDRADGDDDARVP